jgi:hypothetical protein
MSTSQATKVITASARSVLRPFGCIQKGRSRIWLDDRSWWVGVVEFQPSGWSMGSYLNVSASWLWGRNGDLSFDVPSLRREFHPFLEEDQFSISATLLAEDAKAELIALRERFCSPLDVSKFLSRREHPSIWDYYHLGVSAGLAGEMDLARQSFKHVMSWQGDQPWCDDVRKLASGLIGLLDCRDAFKAKITSIVERKRDALKLPDRDVVFSSR